jgi:glutathione S-transferase
LTIADFSFVTWAIAVPFLLEGSESEEEIKKYKNYARWMETLNSYPAVKKTLELRNKAISE